MAIRCGWQWAWAVKIKRGLRPAETWEKEVTLHPTTPKHTFFSSECVILSSID